MGSELGGTRMALAVMDTAREWIDFVKSDGLLCWQPPVSTMPCLWQTTGYG